jgi:hypothetical protein
MRKFLLAVTALVLIVPTVSEAQQRAPQNPPSDLWCRDQPIAGGGSTATICMAYTYEQCMASRATPTERCYMNPRYDPRFR